MENTSVEWTVNGKAVELSSTVAALLALENQGLCVVRLALQAAPGKGFVLMPGQAALALAIGRRQYLLESKAQVPARALNVESLMLGYLKEARGISAGTAKLAMEGTGYLARIQKDMADGMEPGEAEGPKA